MGDKTVEWYPLEEVVKLLSERKWNWLDKPQTKYLELRIDTRDMHCVVFAGQIMPQDRNPEAKTGPRRILFACDIDELREKFERLDTLHEERWPS